MNDFITTISNDSTLSRAGFLLLMYFQNNKKYDGLQSELGDKLKLDRRTVNESLKKLEESGYISRKPKRGDRRMRTIVYIGGQTNG